MTRAAFSPPIAIGFATLVALTIVAGAFLANGGWTTEGAAAATRLTARASFLWFVTAWSASALARLWPGGWRTWLLRRRRSIGLAFAATHTIHLAALLTAILLFGRTTHSVTVIGGGIGYVFVFAMAITSNDASVRRLGPRRWHLLHATGGYVIAGIFAFSYLGRVPHNPALGVPMLSLLGLAALLRILAWSSNRRRGRSAQLQPLSR